jgi:hypothetical protein
MVERADAARQRHHRGCERERQQAGGEGEG